ncbi:hypothetical protein GSI_15500 [Ganoderma sinense ZZ0214-1]|uniref:Uncharacterized protein n=1 Tax=Ganoderma sinense ZZ0214-1 TaxID=1077348 RepID=A0A2G8RMR3_9APHY|nr:hypothetical protein GSI_15500 [Ganoderma sinense ZZ0214-1]
MNNSARSTAFTIGEVKPFRAPVRTFGSPYKSNPKAFQRYREVVQGPLGQKHIQKTIRLNSPSPVRPVTHSELDDLVKGVRSLALADAPVPMQASFPGEDDFHISIAAAPYRSSTLFGPPSSCTLPLGGELAKGTEAIVGVQMDAGSSASRSGPPTSSHSWSDDTLSKNDEAPGGLPPPPMFRAASSLPDSFGNPTSPRSPPLRPIHTTPARRPGLTVVPTTSPMDSSNVSRPCLTTISVSLTYEVFASPDAGADEGLAWSKYPVRRGTLDLSVSAPGRGLTFEATVEV